MSACRLIASDRPLAEYAPPRSYPVRIDIDNGILDDGGTDDNYYLTDFPDGRDYTQKEYAVALEWDYTEGRAGQIIQYIKAALQQTDRVEFWLVWLTDYCEFEDRPFIHRKTVPADQLTTAHIKQINDAVIWNTPDRTYPGRPSFYCLTVTP